MLIATRLTSAGRITRKNRQGDDQQQGSAHDDRGEVCADRVADDDHYW
ncbi:MAG: hypothetical protein WA630_23320 [Mycobacterium sp.]